MGLEGIKAYELTDHLGNPRVIFNELRLESYTFNKLATPPSISHTGSLLMIDPVEMNNYYPFGMIKEGMFASLGEGYRYGFNGMERDNESKGFGNDLSTFFRGYDPRLGRWKSTDPVTKAMESAYVGFGNNPVFFVDPRGDVVDNYGFGPDPGTSTETVVNKLKKSDWLQNESPVPIMSSPPPKYPAELRSAEKHPVGQTQFLRDWKKSNEERIPITPIGHIGHALSVGTFETLDALGIASDNLLVKFGIVSRDVPIDITAHWVTNDNKLTDALATSLATGMTLVEGSGIRSFTFGLNQKNIVYRGITKEQLATIKAGQGMYAKNPNGPWSLEMHLIHGSSEASHKFDRFIAFSPDLEVAQSFNSGYGIIGVDLTKIPDYSIRRGWLELPRTSKGYHFSIWQQEVSIERYVPQEAIILID